jgi:hypothetical protein
MEEEAHEIKERMRLANEERQRLSATRLRLAQERADVEAKLSESRQDRQRQAKNLKKTAHQHPGITQKGLWGENLLEEKLSEVRIERYYGKGANEISKI